MTGSPADPSGIAKLDELDRKAAAFPDPTQVVPDDELEWAVRWGLEVGKAVHE